MLRTSGQFKDRREGVFNTTDGKYVIFFISSFSHTYTFTLALKPVTTVESFHFSWHIGIQRVFWVPGPPAGDLSHSQIERDG